MREIKFRIWDDILKIMFTSQDESNMWKIDALKNGILQPSPNSIVMQYTELKDKNGKDIYEGDIIRSLDSENNEIIHFVIYDQENARFALENKNKSDFYSPMQISQQWLIKYEKEVIGNIYENSELLNK